MSEAEAMPFLKTVRVCTECRDGLVALGGVALPGVQVISLGWTCEAHPDSLRAQAQHTISVAPTAIREWLESPRMHVVDAFDNPAPGDDPQAVALLACQFLVPTLVHDEVPSNEAVFHAVRTARRVLHVAKGLPL
jgi:hypothetical protein